MDIVPSEMTVLTGDNDSGKSNVLRALNLFFNDMTDIDNRFDFNNDFSRYAITPNKTAPSIKIKLTLKTPPKYKQKYIEWEKIWRNGYDEYYDEKISSKRGGKLQPRTKAVAWARALKFRYVPAIKSRKFFSHILSLLHDSLAEVTSTKFHSAIHGFTKEINMHTTSLSHELNKILQFESNIQAPESMHDLFGTLDFETDCYGKKIPLKMRGDGIISKHIAAILHNIAGYDRSKAIRGSVQPDTIWGYEEPENSMEMTRAFELAELFQQYVSEGIQIFCTTHSPVFYGATKETENSKLFFCSNNDCGETELHKIYSDGINYLDSHMGVMPLIEPHLAAIRNEVEQNKLIMDQAIKDLQKFTEDAIFVEGKIDKQIIEMCFEWYKQDIPVIIRTKEKAGASWVSSMLVATASLDVTKKSFGLFDYDDAGIEGYENALKYKKKGARNTTKGAIALSYLIDKKHDFYKKAREALQKIGINSEPCIEIEHLFPNELWSYAFQEDMVEFRDTTRLKGMGDNETRLEFLVRKGLDDNTKKFLYKIKDSDKINLLKYIQGLELYDNSTFFKEFKPIIDKIVSFFQK